MTHATGSRRHVVLFLAANPRGTTELELTTECAEIQRQFETAPHRDDFDFQARWATGIDDLVDHLMKLEPAVIHFSGHGSGSLGLVLQDDHGVPELVSPRALAHIIRAAARNVRLVVLNACYSLVQAEVLRDLVDCVIGMPGAIADRAARVFAIHFYRALGNRRSIGNAVDVARAALTDRDFIHREAMRDVNDAPVESGDALLSCRTRGGADQYAMFLGARTALERASGGGEFPAVFQSPGLGTDTFVGRDRELAELEQLLERADAVQVRVALDGMPGIGKTELARQIVARLARRGTFRGGIFWLSAAHRDLRLQWAKIAEDLGAPALQELGERAAWAVRHVERRAQRGEPVLIVLDNVESWAPEPEPMPDLSAVRLLVTTPLRWLHNSFRRFEVSLLGPADARQLLHAVVGREVEDSDDLLHALGGHVLSIELAGSYLREYGTPATEYHRRLVTGTGPGASVADQTSYRATAESAFRLLWRRIADELRSAWRTVAQLAPAWFSTELADAIGVDVERRARLVRLHILERDPQARYHMHRLLREFALRELPDLPSVHDAVIRGATHLLEAGDPELLFQRYRHDADSYYHLLESPADVACSVRFMAASGTALQQLGELSAARLLLEAVLTADCSTYGSDHPVVAMRRASLGSLLQELGELSQARTMFEQALASDLATHGEAHPTVAARRASLAGLLRQLNDLAPARTLYEQALASDLHGCGEHAPIVAIRRASLAGVLQDLGDLVGARRLYEQALASDLARCGDNHPAVAARRASLAGLLRQLGDLSGARVLYERALAADLATYGDGHPRVATRRANLGGLLQQLGDLPAARRLYEQALASDLETYGEAHATVAIRRAKLAGLLRRHGELAEARALYEQALASVVSRLGDHHPQAAKIRGQLGHVLRKLGNLAGARCLFEQALASHLRAYGEDHPEVAIHRGYLADVLRRLGDLVDAQALFEQALSAACKVYGDDHPSVATLQSKYARLLEELGDLEGARALLEQALASARRTFSEDHPSVAAIRSNLLRLLPRLGDPPVACAV